MNEHCGSRPLARKRGNGANALVFSHRVMMHRREQTDDAQSQIVECASRARFGVRLCRIEHERACDPIRERRYGCGDRLFVIRHAGDHQSARDAVTIELSRADYRQRNRIAWRCRPAGDFTDALYGVRFFPELNRLADERIEKFAREEMHMGVEHFQIAERSGLFQYIYLLRNIKCGTDLWTFPAVGRLKSIRYLLYSDLVTMPTIFTHGAIGFTA